MVGNPEILELYERIDTLKKRYGRVNDIRIDALKKKSYSHNKILEFLTKLVNEPLGSNEINNVLQQIFAEMNASYNANITDQRSYDVIVQVMTHERHMPLILKYLEQLDTENTDSQITQIKTQMINLNDIYNTMLTRTPLVKASLDQQVKLQENFSQTGSLNALIKYLQEFRNEQKIEQEILEEIIPKSNALINAWNATTGTILSAMRTEKKFIDKHKVAFAFASIGMLGMGLLFTFFLPPVLAGEAVLAVGLLSKIKGVFSFGKGAINVAKISVETGNLALKVKDVTKNATEIIDYCIKTK